VKVYLHKLFTKLGLKSRHEVCAWGFAHRDLWEGEVPQLSAKEDQDA
jgi:hypothetical protein